MKRVTSSIFSIVAVLSVLLGDRATAQAQAADTTLSDHIARLSLRASQLLPYLDYEVLSRLQAWIQGIAVAIAVLVLLFGFLRLWRENAGGNSNLVFYFVRSLFFFGMVGTSAWLIGQMAATGKEIAEGNELQGANGGSLLYDFYKAQRDSFTESFERMTIIL